MGINSMLEDRTGGDILYIKGRGDNTHSYFEKNNSRRFSTRFSFDHRLSSNDGFVVKNAISSFNRTITIPGYTFDGRQWSTYSEIAYSSQRDKMDWVGGINLYTDNFKEVPFSAFPKRNYAQNTGGGFVQNTWKASQWLRLETGLRGDYVADYGFVVLPRISALLTITPKLSSRLGGGLGYKTPTIFTEETERIQFQSVLPVNPDDNKLEKSYGASFDINYRFSLFEKIRVSINQLFFYTRINNPLLLSRVGINTYKLLNSGGHYDTRGGETNIKLGYGDFKLFLGYTYTDARLHVGNTKGVNPLTPRHRLNNVLMYEIEDKWKLGVEAYYYSHQLLNDGTTGQSYWLCGFMAEKLWEHISLFINFENFTDTRQTRFDTIYTGTVTNPVFRDIYAPLDGFVVNGGIRLRL